MINALVSGVGFTDLNSFTGHPPILKTFEGSFDEIKVIVERKRYTWTFKASVYVDFDDFLWKTLNHINKKWHLYDQTRSLGAWVHQVVENQMKNELRNLYLGTSSPCKGCAWARGEDGCEVFNEQESMDCPYYSNWYNSNKRHKHIARMPLPIEGKRELEVYSIPSQSANIESIAEELHIQMETKLTPSEWTVYQCLYISGFNNDQTAKICDFKSSEGRPAGYGRISQINNKIKKIAREIIMEDGLDTQFV